MLVMQQSFSKAPLHRLGKDKYKNTLTSTEGQGCGLTTATMWPLHVLLGFDIRALLLFCIVLLLIADYLRYRDPPNFPPGPLSFPFVGNFFGVDKTHPHNYYLKVNGQAPLAGRNMRNVSSCLFWGLFGCCLITVDSSAFHSWLRSMGTCSAFALVVKNLCLHLVTKW